MNAITRRCPGISALGRSCGQQLLLVVLVYQAMAANLSFASGAEPAATLARLVPADAGLCVEARDLAEKLPAFCSGEIWRRLRAFPPVSQFLTDNAPQLTALRESFQSQTGMAPYDLMIELLGRQALVAVWPGTAGDDGLPGPALLLLDAPDAALLDRVVARLIEAEDAAGRQAARLNWRRGDHTHVIHRIEASAEQPALFVLSDRGLGVLATEQRLVEQVLDFRDRESDSSQAVGGAEQPPAGSLAALPAYVAGMARLNPQAGVRAFVSPRAWAGLIPVPADAQGHLAGRFCQSTYLVGSCEVRDRLAVEAYLVAGDEQPLPESSPTTPAPADDLAARLPGNAVAAFAGRIDLPLLIGTFFSETSSPDAAEEADLAQHKGLRAIATLLQGDGREAVAALLPRDDQGAGSSSARKAPYLGADWIVGVDIRSLLPSDRMAIARRLDPVLHGALTAMVMFQNKQGENLETDSSEERGIPLTSVVGVALFGQGDTTTFSLVKGFFWAGTKREVVRDAASLQPSDGLGARPQFMALENPRVGPRSHLAYVDLAGLGKLIDTAVGPRTEAQGATALTAVKDPALESDPELLAFDLREVLKLADRVLLEVEITPTRLGLSATFEADVAP